MSYSAYPHRPFATLKMGNGYALNLVINRARILLENAEHGKPLAKENW